MSQIQVTISSAHVVLSNKEFTVTDGNKVLLRDTISGKLSSKFIRQYQVETPTGVLSAQFTDGDMPELTISASLI